MLSQLISRSNLKKQAAANSFARGEEYFASGAVGRLSVMEGKVSAKVSGSASYQVALWDKGGKLEYDCTCPHAEDGYFCKHCVAVGLAYLAQGENPVSPLESIKTYLHSQSSDTLIALLLEAVQHDDALFQSLLLKAECKQGGADVVQAFRRAIDAATKIHGYLDWDEVSEFADNLSQLADSLAELLKPDSAASLVELTEYALERIERSMEEVDDSSGEVGAAADAVSELHLEACMMARPEPLALAARLFKFEITSDFGLWRATDSVYQSVLGEAGTRRYRELVEAAWQKFAPVKVGDSYNSHRNTIKHIMERLAQASGNVDELIAIKARDLSHAYDYLAIAEILNKAEQPNQALMWAERGLAAFPQKTDSRLRDFLVATYLKRGRNDEAVQLTWLTFEETPSFHHYLKLHDVTMPLGLWTAQRERALDKVTKTMTYRGHATWPNYALRVEIALWEQDWETAWTAAHEGNCGQSLMLKLAEKISDTRPDDAISVYLDIVPAIVAQGNNGAYQEAIVLVKKIGKLMLNHQHKQAFINYLAILRTQFKAKRNFIKLLNELVSSSV
ncbi:MAG: DUF6880 family protein [Gallionella sp.]